MVMTLALLLATAPEPQLSVSLVKSSASASASAVTRELKEQLGALEGCYHLAVKDTPALRGAVTATFRIEPDVGVATIAARPESVKNGTLISCVLARLRFAEWPNPKKAITVTATFRFEQKAP